MKRRNIVVLGIMPLFIVGVLSLTAIIRSDVDFPLVGMIGEWSIGIYEGESPVDLRSPSGITNPVLTAQHITDVSAEFVADPFLISVDDVWYMYFEVLNADTEQGDIGLATSQNGLEWTYAQIVLDEPFHLSYPYVFEFDNAIYMIPESGEADSVRLYRATDFPTEWTFERVLLEGYFLDPSIFYHDGMWWLFAVTEATHTLRLYFADDLTSTWQEHPLSPIVTEDLNISRPGGRVVVTGDRIIRYAQDGDPSYGNQVWAFEITELTASTYNEHAIEPAIVGASGSGWNGYGMHHIDPHQVNEPDSWLAAVDGIRRRLVIGF